MPYLSGPGRFLRRIFSWPRDTTNNRSHTSATANGSLQQATHQEQYLHEIFEKDVDDRQREELENRLDSLELSRKRKATEDADSSFRKRRRTAQIIDEQSSTPVLSEAEDNDKAGQAPTKNGRSDRELMPPPPIPSTRHNTTNHTHRTTASTDSVDASSDTRVSNSESETDPDMEMFRRQNAVTGLPPNSGIWELDERELWVHINDRGREALLPHNWMIDFPTLPLNLFATGRGQVPLIQCYKSSEFRAIKALQELIDTGKTLRDRTFGPNGQLRREITIEKAMNKYMKWGLKDASISDKQYIPVHVTVARKKGQSSRDVIHELALKMHKLSSHHREESGVLTSIERELDGDDRDGHNETQLGDDLIDAEHTLPTIYGVAITSSVLTVFTLNSHTLPPPYIVRALSKSKQQRDQDDDNDDDYEDDGEAEESEEDGKEAEDEDDGDAGLKMIDSFDFSESAQDVWNAFVIVIVTMMIRKTLLEIYDFDAVVDEQDFDESMLDGSMVDGSSIGYYGNHHRSNGRSKIEDDPDL